jgi:predicted lactoylglutathione lyase
MLSTHDKAKQFTSKKIADAHETTEVLNALSTQSKEAVDELVDKALDNGGTKAGEPQDHGFMYSRSFNDPDGHIWEVLWMDMEQVPEE